MIVQSVVMTKREQVLREILAIGFWVPDGHPAFFLFFSFSFSLVLFVVFISAILGSSFIPYGSTWLSAYRAGFELAWLVYSGGCVCMYRIIL